MNDLREHIHPGLRGAFFYAAYWGAVGMYEPFLNVYFLQVGFTGAQIGWIAAILPLCTLLINPLVSRMADRTHRRRAFLAATCLGFALSFMLPALPGLPPTFVVLALITALFSAFRSPIIALADSLIAPMAVRRGLDFGQMRLWGSLIFTFTAVGLGAVWQQTGFKTMFVVSGLFLVPVGLAALLLEEPHREPAASAAHAKGVRAHPVDPGLLFMLAGLFLVIAALFMVINFGTVYMTQLGGQPWMVGGIMGFAALGEVPGMLYGTRIARRLGETSSLIAGYALIAAGLAGYALAQIPWVLLVFSAVRGMGFGLVVVGSVMIINDRAPRDYASTYQGLMVALCYGLAPLIGGPTSGWIYQTFGPPTLFAIASGMSAAAALLMIPTYRIWGRR